MCHGRVVRIQERMIREAASAVPEGGEGEGMVWATTEYLEECVREAGFVDVRVYKVLVPMVDHRPSHPTAKGEGEVEGEDYISSVMRFFGAIKGKAVEMGYVEDEKEYDGLLEGTERELREMARGDEGGTFAYTWWAVCARKAGGGA